MEDHLPYDCLPVIVVSAKDTAAASSIISEIIDNEFTEVYKGGEDLIERDRVWRIVNKYYTADVRLHPVADDDELSSEVKSAEAQVIYLTEEEAAGAAGPEAVRRRAAAAGRADTRLVAVGGRAALGAGLRGAAARARAELVRLAPADDDDDEDEERGAARVRSALQAHRWAAAAAAGAGAEADDVERAELFFAALAALPAAAERARGAADAADAASAREARLARAEALVAAFCRALGDDC